MSELEEFLNNFKNKITLSTVSTAKVVKVVTSAAKLAITTTTNNFNAFISFVLKEKLEKEKQAQLKTQPNEIISSRDLSNQSNAIQTIILSAAGGLIAIFIVVGMCLCWFFYNTRGK